MEYNYYKILSLDSTANELEIKRSFRKLAFKFHPDRNSDNKAKEFFQLLNEAYATLSDTKKRKQYDKKNNFNQSIEDSILIHQKKRKSRAYQTNHNSVYQFYSEKVDLPPKFVRIVLFSTGFVFGLFMMVFPIIQTVEDSFSPTIILVFLGFILTVDSVAGLTGYRTMLFYELFRLMRNWFKPNLQNK